MSEPTTSSCYPSLTYDDARAAIDRLCDVLGFEERLVVAGTGGAVVHSELSREDVVVMVSSPRDTEGRSSPTSLGGVTCALSLRCDDPDALHARVVAAGWEVLHDLKDEEYGSRGFMTRDPGGQQWYLGTYRPGAHWDAGEAG